MEIEKWIGQKVGDQIVVSTEQAPTPLGSGRVYAKAVTLNLDNGAKAYGCTWGQSDCAFTYDNPTTIATGHWKVHEVTPDLRRVPFGDWTIKEILGRLMDSEADLKQVMEQRDKAIQAKGTGNQADKELIAELRKDLREANAKVRDYEKAFKIFGKLMPNAPQQ